MTIKPILLNLIKFTDVIKKIEIDFSTLYQKGLSKIYSLEKVRSPGMGEVIPLKKGRNRWEESLREEHLWYVYLLRKKIKKVFNCLLSFKSTLMLL